MGHVVVCSCGQRNDLDVFGFGEARLCLSCGKALSPPKREMLAEAFTPELPVGALDAGPSPSSLASFESPAERLAEEEAETGEQVVASSAMIGTPTAAGGPDRRAANGSAGCVRCGSAFRGDWDRNERPDGVYCHRCATQAQGAYVPPTEVEKRALYRAEPPRPLAQPEIAEAAAAEDAKRRKGLLTLGVVGGATVLFAMIFPVEIWIAGVFHTDYEAAGDLPVAWVWVVRVLGFALNALAQGVTLYATLAMLDMLYGDRNEDIRTVFWIAIGFAVIDALSDGAAAFLSMFGPLVMGLSVLAFYLKVSLLNRNYPFGIEDGLRLILAWLVVSLILGPAMTMVEWLVGGMIAALIL